MGKLSEQIYMKRLNYLKAISLILVVIGHCTNMYKGDWVFESQNSSHIYKWISIYVNTIHMQIFVFVSGVIYKYCKKRKEKYKNYKYLIVNKFKRLMVPYFIVGFIFVIPISIMVGIKSYSLLYFNNIKPFILGYNNGHLWFLMMLYTLFLIFFILEKCRITEKELILLIVLFLMQVFYSKITRVFLLNKAIYYMFFFFLGYVIFDKYDILYKFENVKTNKKIKFIVSIFVMNIGFILLKEQLPQIKLITLIINNFINDIIAILGIIQMYMLVSIDYSRLYMRRFLEIINKYNFDIYLLHEPIIFIVLYKIRNSNPSFVVFVCFILSISISIMFAKLYRQIKNNFWKRR